MNIKSRIKKLGIKLIDISRELDISRPTLDSYIKLYESGKELPHDKYQIIFDKLFNDGVETIEDFNRVLYGYHNLIERDKILGIKDLNAEETDLIGNIMDLIKMDLETQEYDKDIYIFINMVLGSYKKVSTFGRVAKYFLLLNNAKSINELDGYSDSDKAFYSNLFKVMKQDVDNKNKFDEKSFNKFRNRIIEIEEKEAKKTEEKTREVIENKLKERINKIINDKRRLGIEIDDLDINQIIKSIDISDLL